VVLGYVGVLDEQAQLAGGNRHHAVCPKEGGARCVEGGVGRVIRRDEDRFGGGRKNYCSRELNDDMIAGPEFVESGWRVIRVRYALTVQSPVLVGSLSDYLSLDVELAVDPWTVYE
jgi:hypothetical protein